MSLPNGFDTPCEYFKQAIDFLHQYSWIYQEANTCFLKSKIMTKMPQEFHDYFQQIDTDQLHPFVYVHQPLDGDLNSPLLAQFRQQLSSLIPVQAFDEPPSLHPDAAAKNHLKMENFKKMNVKKQHEIQRLANAIHQQRLDEQQRCVLIDFGCGLGYLSEILYKLNDNLLILGLESDLYRVEAAEKRLKTYMPQAEQAIRYRQEYITENSRDFINETAKELLQSNYENKVATTTVNTSLTMTPPETVPPPRMAIIGLHACADLTITSMKLFLRMPQVRHLIIMPCCYHKMQMCGTTLKFHNFPLSRSLQEVLSAENYSSGSSNYVAFLNRPFLRLACQQTLKRWQKCSTEQHALHGRQMFLRALAEALNRKETEVVVKRKDKIDLNSLGALDFENFKRSYRLQSKCDDVFVEWSADHEKQFYELLEQHPNGDKLAEGLTCLQTSMQKLCENLVLYDRLCYMQEAATELKLNLNVRYEKLMDEELSPRCYVLIAEKL